VDNIKIDLEEREWVVFTDLVYYVTGTLGKLLYILYQTSKPSMKYLEVGSYSSTSKYFIEVDE
jgi:hypothetical protein